MTDGGAQGSDKTQRPSRSVAGVWKSAASQPRYSMDMAKRNAAAAARQGYGKTQRHSGSVAGVWQNAAPQPRYSMKQKNRTDGEPWLSVFCFLYKRKCVFL